MKNIKDIFAGNAIQEDTACAGTENTGSVSGEKADGVPKEKAGGASEEKAACTAPEKAGGAQSESCDSAAEEHTSDAEDESRGAAVTGKIQKKYCPVCYRDFDTCQDLCPLCKTPLEAPMLPEEEEEYLEMLLDTRW